MSTLPAADVQVAQPPTEPIVARRATVAFCLPTMPADIRASLIERIREKLGGEPLLIASPDGAEEQSLDAQGSRLVPYPAARGGGEWVLGAADYLAAHRLVEEHGLEGAVLLGPEAATVDGNTVAGLHRTVVAGTDLGVPRYDTDPQQGLVNSALLYPLTRALFGVDVHFPLPLDAGLSRRMLQRLGPLASRVLNGNEEGLVWPVAEASTAAYSIGEVEHTRRQLPQPQETDLYVLFPAVCASLFTDVEAKAAFWQRARTLPGGRATQGVHAPHPVPAEEVGALVEGFRLAFSNLREIWSLVLPPQSLLSLKKMSATPAESFAFPPNLWARVVYDFALAFHLRTLNRGHLLGAMTPLYLAWVGSLLQEASRAPQGGSLLDTTATAFEQEKPYLVSRWRWPDRFNP